MFAYSLILNRSPIFALVWLSRSKQQTACWSKKEHKSQSQHWCHLPFPLPLPSTSYCWVQSEVSSTGRRGVSETAERRGETSSCCVGRLSFKFRNEDLLYTSCTFLQIKSKTQGNSLTLISLVHQFLQLMHHNIQHYMIMCLGQIGCKINNNVCFSLHLTHQLSGLPPI